MFNQKGASLVEFMIASSLGLISLGIVGSLYISGQKVVMERSKELMLLQNTGSVLAMLRNDIQRAGFNEGGSDSVKISGATDTIYTLDTPGMGLIAYAYQIGTSGAAPLYKNVVYEQRINTPESLFVCEKKQTTIWNVSQVIALSGTGTCNTLFDKRSIHINRFDLAAHTLKNTDAESAVVTITLGTELVGATSVQTEQSFTVKQRNWQ
ncbi:PilW family protein [Vibrio owensii]|uniref:PilW family protein n=1 Tax=Vibrio owensii TaxID=696485 RepID=UPI00215CB693|nr:pilus assembly protein PilW [Vibrio owensii]MCR9942964.1 pilus assembly protein PilW [Vibrio owensii]